MANRSPRAGHHETLERLKALKSHVPPSSEIHRLLTNLDDPANDDMSKDRYTAIVAGGAVDEALRIAIERAGAKVEGSFHGRIVQAHSLGIVTDGQAVELQKLRLIRNVFAHSLAPLGFDSPEIREATRGLWDHPVTDWAGYFAPVFAPRHHYAIVCGEFYRLLMPEGCR